MKDPSSMTVVHPKPTKVKYKKAPQAPRRFKSAYMFYSTWKHPNIRENLLKDQKNLRTPEVAKMVSRSWNQLTPGERAPWEEMARKDKARFELEKSLYSGPWKVPNVKDPKAPKRPVSAFLSFSKERRSQVKRDGAHLSTTQISAVLARMWKEAPEKERQKYIELDTKDRERYRRELKTYNEAASQGRKKREELAFRAIHIAEKPGAAKRYQSPQQDETGSDLSDACLLNELMNQPLMIDVQDIEAFSSSSIASDTSLDSGMGAVAIDLETVDRLPCSPPAEARGNSKQFNTTGDPGFVWEPIPLCGAPEEAPVSPEPISVQSSVFTCPAVITPPKLEVRPKELVRNETVTTPGGGSYAVHQPEPLLSRSFPAPLSLPSAYPWYSPRSVGLMPRIADDTSCFEDHHQQQQRYDTFPYHQIARRSSWDAPSYDNNTANGYSQARHQPPNSQHSTYISQCTTPQRP